MFTKLTTATIVLSGLFLSANTQANEVSVEQLVGSFVSQAVYATQQEISYSVQEAVLTANNTIGFETEAQTYATNVTITDLESTEVVSKSENDKAE
ncbi:hypothetical protein [Aliiglaciecola sp. LCG003]|uniref:hypothetical protein n=1 Tax=Aliiglaciecola sp. LCG003 TaxID=3053655 RepID=UPI0025727623|nr:hypothetical protein [Aliiglaciecola sp. LCG003]WJG09916.1 hypothetical protein QR722_02450 [Aliiglaciecola sp. LCG003]